MIAQMKQQKDQNSRRSESRAGRLQGSVYRFAALIVWFGFALGGARANAQYINRNNGIIGGSVVNAQDAVVSSTVALYDGEGLCSGSIVDVDLVVTAAHCISDHPEKMRVIFGTNLRDKKTIVATLPVVGALQHPAWKTTSNNQIDTNDIALVRFSGSLPQGYKPATLLPSTNVLQVGSSVILAGFGTSDGVNGTGSGVLRRVTVNVAHPYYGKTEIEFDQSHGRGACHGDSGGPAFYAEGGKPYLFGVTSRGADPCNVSVIYTKIEAHRDFLAQASASLRRGQSGQQPNPAAPKQGFQQQRVQSGSRY